MAWPAAPNTAPAIVRPFCSPVQTIEPSTFKKNDPTVTEKEFKRRLESVVTEWLWVDDVPKLAVTLLLRPSAKIAERNIGLSATEASLAVRIFMDRLSGRVFPSRQVRKGKKRLRHAFVSEFGEKSGLHYHGWIEIPEGMETEPFIELVETTWRRLKFADTADLKPVWSKGAVGYMLKDKPTGEFFDHIDLRNIHLTR